MSDISEKLRQLRIERSLGLKELGALIHRSPSTISNYENGVHDPDLDTLVLLADFYGVTTDYLLGRTIYPFPVEDMPKMVYGGYTVSRFLLLLHRLPEKEKAFLAHLMGLFEKTYHLD